MKTKNQSEQTLFKAGATNAANEDGIAPSRDAAPVRQQAWSPMEVWRTRVKPLSTRRNTTGNAQI